MQVLFVSSLSSTDGPTCGRTETVLEVLADLRTQSLSLSNDNTLFHPQCLHWKLLGRRGDIHVYHGVVNILMCTVDFNNHQWSLCLNFCVTLSVQMSQFVHNFHWAEIELNWAWVVLMG